MTLKIGVLSYLDKDGHTCMLLKDKPGHYMHGLFVAPGGKRKQNESLEAAAIRETFEETGICPRLVVPKGSLHFPDYGNSPFGAEWLCFVYSFSEYDGEPLKQGPEGEVHFPMISALEHLPMYKGDKLFTPFVFKSGYFSARFVYSGQELVEHEIKLFD